MFTASVSGLAFLLAVVTVIIGSIAVLLSAAIGNVKHSGFLLVTGIIFYASSLAFAAVGFWMKQV